MSFRRRHRWLRRLALGLAVFGAVAAGNAGYALAKGAPATSNAHHVSTPGWSGLVDGDSGVPLSAGIPEGDEPFIAEAVLDPYLTDVFARPGEVAAGPDGISVAEWGHVPAIRPDDARNRFAHSDVAPKPQPAGGGSTFELDDALTAGIGALVLALGLGLALGVLRRPRLAGL